MNQATELQLVTQLNNNLTEILKSKASDYADEDVLSNFKKVSAAVKALDIDTTTPTGYALLMVVLKICRITNLIKDKKNPKNESIEDSFGDGINYFKLAYLCDKEERDNNKTGVADASA